MVKILYSIYIIHHFLISRCKVTKNLPHLQREERDFCVSLEHELAELAESFPLSDDGPKSALFKE